MTKLFAVVLAILASSCASRPAFIPNESLLERGFSGIPSDAASVAERLAGCNHFAGEVGDNPPERAAEIAKAVNDLGCDRIEQDVVTIRAKYAGNRKVSDALAVAADL